MALKLDAEAQAALDLAKRSLADGEELDVARLLRALCHTSSLRETQPALAERFAPLQALRTETPEKVIVAAELRPILGRFAQADQETGANALFQALAESETGRKLLGAATPGWRDSPERRKAVDALSTFGRMLTVGEPPHAGSVEMEETIRSLVRTLTRMRRRNAILVGPPGTGKSAVIYELARRLVTTHPSIPERLRDFDLFELSPSFLRSGASVVGQYDERVKTLIGILKAHPKIVLFVDEIHSLLQSGMHERSPWSDANESFKSVLGRGEITCLGCTTPAEYRHYIEPDKALVRRFSVLRLDPPSREATLAILKARRPRMEAYFEPLRIPDAALEKARELSDEYLPGRFQPDKSIQLLDDACAWCATSDPPVAEVTEDALWHALEDMIGHSVVRSERLTEQDVYEQLRARIIGQDDALHAIARAFVSGLGGWTRSSGPRGVFLFCGPTGVGKTETALRLAELLAGRRLALLEVNCNTLQGAGHDAGPAINVLLGPPPGYVGYVRGQGGLLTRVRDVPECIVLFDEIEKADPAIAKVLLQILDDGRIEDSAGNPLDFRRAFIVFTTNAGAVYERHRIGFVEAEGAPPLETPSADVESVRGELRGRGFGEEFLGRIGHFIVFGGLSRDAIREIIGVQLARLRDTADLRGYALGWEPEIVEYLSAAWEPRFGVRHLATILRHRIVEQLSVAEAQGELAGVKRIALDAPPNDAPLPPGAPPGAASRERREDTLVIHLF
jgi:ATP-dependent Clp protease ATP-binding subunit ClpA